MSALVEAAAAAQGVEPVADVPEAFAQLVEEAFADRAGPRFSLVLSGGPTAEACYERLAALPRGVIDWSLVDVFMGDERWVPPEDPDANSRLVRQSLLDPVGGAGSFSPMPTSGTPAEAVAAYQAVLAPVVAAGGFDLIHLGMGPDGHTASLFPGVAELDQPDGDELVAATTDPNGHNPHPRLTVTLPAIAAARLAVFTVAGDTKRQAMAELLAGRDIPAARVRARAIRWLVDEAAMGTDPATTT